MCTDVCARGSVVLEPWLAHAIKQQAKLVQSLPLCFATLLGTHNSAISLADGYGNLDEYFRGGPAVQCLRDASWPTELPPSRTLLTSSCTLAAAANRRPSCRLLQVHQMGSARLRRRAAAHQQPAAQPH